MIKKLILTGMLAGCIGMTHAQNIEYKDPFVTNQEDLSFAERWAFKTNMVGCVLMAPNIGLEYDLSNSIYGKWTVGAQITWNGTTGLKTDQSIQARVNDYRLEVRRYKKPGLTTKKGKNSIPKFWRTYYWGIYAAYGDYGLLWGKGKKGQYYSAGLSGGWQIPLYGCRNRGEVALDLGMSLGLVGTKFDKYRVENNQVVKTATEDWHVVPFPVPTEIKIGLVYRFDSIKNKYKNR